MAPINSEAKEIQLSHLAEREPRYCHKMSLIDVAKEFVSLYASRLNTFGKFKDLS